jgi:hypothetical protein
MMGMRSIIPVITQPRVKPASNIKLIPSKAIKGGTNGDKKKRAVDS